MEHRSYHRYPLNFSAQISAGGQGAQSCRIRDFCLGGVFISFSSVAGREDFKIDMGDNVVLHVNIPTQKGAHSFQVQSKVVRLLNDGAGLSFLQPDPAAIQALQNLAKQNSQQLEQTKIDSSRYSRDDVHRILALIRRGVADHLSALLQGFFSEAEESLFNRAERARNNQEQHQFLNAIAELKKHRGKIITSFSKEALDQMDELAATGTIRLKENDLEEIDKSLSLINKDEFEDWLVIKVMISKAETKYRENLFALQIRFSQLTGGLFNEENNPVGPSIVGHAFSKSLAILEITAEAEKLIYQVFENVVIFRLGDLYEDLNSVLINSGVMPEINFSKFVQGKLSKFAGQANDEPIEEQPQAEQETHVSAERQSTPWASSPSPFGSQQFQQPQSRSEDRSSPPPCAQPGLASAVNSDKFEEAGQRFRIQQKIARNAYSTVQNLIKLQKESHLIGQKKLAQSNNSQASVGPADGQESVTKQTVVEDSTTEVTTSQFQDKEEILSTLDNLQKTASHIADTAAKTQSLTAAIEDAIRCQQGDDVVLGEREKELLSGLENLFDAMLETKRLTEASGQFIQSLEIPMAKVLLQDESFFSTEDHPARLVINRLAQLGQKGGVKNVASEKSVQKIVQTIVTDYDRDITVFESALSQLDELIEKQNKIYQRNLERVTEACEGQERLASARSKVEVEINNRIAGKTVPKMIPALLDAGWRELLVLSYLKEGEDGVEWRKAWALIDNLLNTLEPSSDTDNANAMDLSQVYEQVTGKLENVVSKSASSEAALAGFRELLNERTINPQSPIETVEIPTAQSNSATAKDSQIDLQLDPEDENTDTNRKVELKKWIRRAKKLVVGDWVEYHKSESDIIRMRIAWISKELDRFIYVNHQGMKVVELSFAQTVKNLFKGVLTIIREMELPLIEHGLDKMVQSVYDELAFQTSHDELTGLYNRKEFERLLEREIRHSQSHDAQHVLMYIDVDQFKVVNNTCGIEGGDALLKELAELFKSWLTRDGVIARVSGDEFCILVTHCNENDGYQIADNQVNALQNYRFSWNETSHTVGASIGLVVLDKSIADVATAMKMAYIACSSAKEGGRNRIQIYQADDRKFTEQDSIMEWVTKLNQALDEGRLQLRCQQISAIEPREDRLPHYEILLCVEDENGLQIPPGNFIQAAEQYNRMQAVDRWVISNVFYWMVENESILKEIGGCAINLSGHSLNDEGLMEFIFEEMVALKVPRNKLFFEVTETATISNLTDAADFIKEMRNIGCKFSLDDFGSGLSSYAYLKNLPVDYIKIDGVFVKDLAEDENDYAVVKSIHEMAAFLGKQTIAEYVENDDILEKLKEIGVDYAQGYGIKKPILLQELAQEYSVPKNQSALF